MRSHDGSAIRNGRAAVALCGVLLAASGTAMAQSTPYLDYSNLYGAGGTISITRLPVKPPAGKFIFRDATITVTADSNGVLTAKVTKQAPSPILNTSNIVAGVYYRSDNSGYRLRVSGPGALGGGGEAKWNIDTVSYYPCGSPAVFYTGPLDQNPLYTRLKAAGITDTSYSYGYILSGSVCGGWNPDYLIGVRQQGDQLQVTLFTNPNTGKDGSNGSTGYGSYLYVLAGH